MTIIRDPRDGESAYLDGGHRLLTFSKSVSIQNVISIENESVFILNAETSWVSSAATQNVMHIENQAIDENLILTSFRTTLITDDTLPNVGSFFDAHTGMAYTSGGNAIGAVNLNLGSPKGAVMAAYEGNPSLAGSPVSLARIRPGVNGATVETGLGNVVVVKPSKTFSVSYTPAASHTGTAFVTITIYFEKPDARR